MIEKEIWKDVPGYEGYYQVSSLGRVKSLDRTITFSNGVKRYYKGKIVKGSLKKGYRQTTLRINNKGRAFTFSQLVAMAFLNHTPNGHTFIVDHINGVRGDDRVENLRIVTKRDNTSYCFRSDRNILSSKYVGVSWYTNVSKWHAKIEHEKKSFSLGYFDNEIKASNAYQKVLSKIKNGTFNADDYKPKWTSKHKGISLDRKNNVWVAKLTVNRKAKYLGSFSTENEAYQALKSYKQQLNK